MRYERGLWTGKNSQQIEAIKRFRLPVAGRGVQLNARNCFTGYDGNYGNIQLSQVFSETET